MRTSWCLVAAVLLAACGGTASTPVVSRPSSSPELVSTTFTISAGGRDRTYNLFRPSSLSAQQAVPLVIVLHGYTESPLELEGTTGFDHEAAQHGFEVVYPLGVNESWNAGTCCGVAQNEKVDDVAFISQLIDRLVSQGGVDPKRVYATGLSNGGFMVNRLACDLASKVTAVASVSGSLVTPCRPSRPISVLEMHGADDEIVPIRGANDRELGGFPPTMRYMAGWAGLDGCRSIPAVTVSGLVTSTTWSACKAGTSVVLQVIKGAAHEWFSSAYVPDEPDATPVAWRFLSSQPPLT